MSSHAPLFTTFSAVASSTPSTNLYNVVQQQKFILRISLSLELDVDNYTVIETFMMPS